MLLKPRLLNEKGTGYLWNKAQLMQGTEAGFMKGTEQRLLKNKQPGELAPTTQSTTFLDAAPNHLHKVPKFTNFAISVLLEFLLQT